MSFDLAGMPALVKQRIFLALTGLTNLDDEPESRAAPRPQYAGALALAKTSREWHDAWCVFKMTHLMRYFGAVHAGARLFHRFAHHWELCGRDPLRNVVAELYRFLQTVDPMGIVIDELVQRAAPHEHLFDRRMYCLTAVRYAKLYHHNVQDRIAVPHYFTIAWEQRRPIDLSIVPMSSSALCGNADNRSGVVMWVNEAQREFVAEVVPESQVIPMGIDSTGEAILACAVTLALMRTLETRKPYDWSKRGRLMCLPRGLYNHCKWIGESVNTRLESFVRADGKGMLPRHTIAINVLFARLGAMTACKQSGRKGLRYKLVADRGTLMNRRYNPQVHRVVEQLCNRADMFFVRYGILLERRGISFADSIMQCNWWTRVCRLEADWCTALSLYEAPCGIAADVSYMSKWAQTTSALRIIAEMPRCSVTSARNDNDRSTSSTRGSSDSDSDEQMPPSAPAPLMFKLSTVYSQQHRGMQGLYKFVSVVRDACAGVKEPVVTFDLSKSGLPLRCFSISVNNFRLVLPRQHSNELRWSDNSAGADQSHLSVRSSVHNNSRLYREGAHHLCFIARNTIGPTVADHEFVIFWDNWCAQEPPVIMMQNNGYTADAHARWFDQYYRELARPNASQYGTDDVDHMLMRSKSYESMLYQPYRVIFERFISLLECKSVSQTMQYLSAIAEISGTCTNCSAERVNTLAVISQCPCCHMTTTAAAATRKRGLASSDSAVHKRRRDSAEK
jgi:hypothetical protein